MQFVLPLRLRVKIQLIGIKGIKDILLGAEHLTNRKVIFLDEVGCIIKGSATQKG
jgi:hypothetical protein